MRRPSLLPPPDPKLYAPGSTCSPWTDTQLNILLEIGDAAAAYEAATGQAMPAVEVLARLEARTGVYRSATSVRLEWPRPTAAARTGLALRQYGKLQRDRQLEYLAKEATIPLEQFGVEVPLISRSRILALLKVARGSARLADRPFWNFREYNLHVFYWADVEDLLAGPAARARSARQQALPFGVAPPVAPLCAPASALELFLSHYGRGMKFSVAIIESFRVLPAFKDTVLASADITDAQAAELLQCEVLRRRAGG